STPDHHVHHRRRNELHESPHACRRDIGIRVEAGEVASPTVGPPLNVPVGGPRYGRARSVSISRSRFDLTARPYVRSQVLYVALQRSQRRDAYCVIQRGAAWRAKAGGNLPKGTVADVATGVETDGLSLPGDARALRPIGRH